LLYNGTFQFYGAEDIVETKTSEAIRRYGFRAISCQAEKQPERKDVRRKPPLPNLRLADVSGSLFFLSID